MNILVTGAAGFIGKNFIGQFMGTNESLFLVDKLSPVSDHDTWYFYHKMAKWGTVIKHVVTADIKYITSNDLEDWGITHVVNFAAETHVDRSITNPLCFTESNVVSTHSLLEQCRKYGKLEKFVQVSTDEVYGSLSDSEAPFTEQSPLKPSSPYSASKLAQDAMAMAYYHTYGLPVCITRCSNNYGYGQAKEKFIPKVIDSVLSYSPITIYGDGLNVRDWIHVDDHCKGVMLTVENGVPGEVYNLGGNNEHSNIEVVHKILKIYEEITGEDRSGLITFVEDRLGHDYRYAIDSTFAKGSIGFEPKTSFEDGLAECVEDYINARYL